MTAVIILILAGILLLVYSHLLSIVVAVLLILAGTAVISIARSERRQQWYSSNPTIEFFIRHECRASGRLAQVATRYSVGI
jgi:hypothetical protein